MRRFDNASSSRHAPRTCNRQSGSFIAARHNPSSWRHSRTPSPLSRTRSLQRWASSHVMCTCFDDTCGILQNALCLNSGCCCFLFFNLLLSYFSSADLCLNTCWDRSVWPCRCLLSQMLFNMRCRPIQGSFAIQLMHFITSYHHHVINPATSPNHLTTHSTQEIGYDAGWDDEGSYVAYTEAPDIYVRALNVVERRKPPTWWHDELT